MGCHIPHCSAQHTDLLWLPDFGASAACCSNASSPIAARQNRKHVSVQCMLCTDRQSHREGYYKFSHVAQFFKGLYSEKARTLVFIIMMSSSLAVSVM